MVATQNIDTLGSIWTFSLRGVLTFMVRGLDMHGCVLSNFEGESKFTLLYKFLYKVQFNCSCAHSVGFRLWTSPS